MGGEPRQPGKRVCLGIEGGGTKTTALFADAEGRILQRLELGPLNLKLSTDAQILSALRRIRSALRPPPFTLSLCLAGCRSPSDKTRLRNLVARVFPDSHRFVGSDLDSGLAAAFGATGSGILVISGTGSCVFGRASSGETARAGGWGHLLGDHGSAYWIAIAGLRAALREHDRRRTVGRPLEKVLEKLALNGPDELTDWIVGASKADVAALAPEFMHGNAGLMLQAASFLALDCDGVAKQLGLKSPDVALRRRLVRASQKVLPSRGPPHSSDLPGGPCFSPEARVGPRRASARGRPGPARCRFWSESSPGAFFIPPPSSFLLVSYRATQSAHAGSGQTRHLQTYRHHAR